MISVAEDLRKFLIAQNIATEQNIHVSRTPAANLENDDQWAIVASSGSKTGGNILQWKRNHNIALLYRNKKGEQLYDKDELLHALEGAISLDNYKVIKATINPMSELDLGNAEVHVGSWQIEIIVIKKGD